MRRRPLASALLAGGLALATPAFYLTLTGPVSNQRAGAALYVLVAILVGTSLWLRDVGHRRDARRMLDFCILLGALACVWPGNLPWTGLEWALRLGYSGLVFLRMIDLAMRHLSAHKPLQILIFAVALVATSGAGFLWLEPRVSSYADGLWLAFITGATVGYGDLVPSTPASRVLAAFIVLLGYALFSVATASIAALLVGEDEKRLRQALHADLRLLRGDIAVLREELRAALPAQQGAVDENSTSDT